MADSVAGIVAGAGVGIADWAAALAARIATNVANTRNRKRFIMHRPPVVFSTSSVRSDTACPGRITRSNGFIGTIGRRTQTENSERPSKSSTSLPAAAVGRRKKIAQFRRPVDFGPG
jgi:hypothetical protein